MIHKSSILFINRAHAAQQLISRLRNYRNTDSCIISTSNGGVAIGNHVARGLNADLVFIPSERIKHPSNPQKSLAVVGLDYVASDDLDRDIPQDFIYRRTRAIQSELSSRYPHAHSPFTSNFQDRIIIFIDDSLQTHDEILSCLRVVRRQQPKKIIVAAPVISGDAAEAIKREADSVVFLHVVSEDSLNNAYLDFDPISDEEVPELIDLAMEEIVVDEISRQN
jgi:predicted phosphoribosyltransferase